MFGDQVRLLYFLKKTRLFYKFRGDLMRGSRSWDEYVAQTTRRVDCQSFGIFGCWMHSFVSTPEHCPTSSMSDPNALPTENFEILLPRLITILELVQQSNASQIGQHRLLISQATNDLKEHLRKAKEIVDGLPGGDMLIEDQDEVIAMLEKMRDQKRAQLEYFSQLVNSNTSTPDRERMEIE